MEGFLHESLGRWAKPWGALPAVNLRKDIPCSLGSFAVFFQPGMDQSSQSYQWINSSNGTSRISRYPLIFPSKNQIFPPTPIQNSQPGSPVLLRWLLGGCSGSLCAAEPFRGLRAFHSTGLRPHQEGLQPKGSCCKWVHPRRQKMILSGVSLMTYHLWHIKKISNVTFFPRFPPGNPKNFGPQAAARKSSQCSGWNPTPAALRRGATPSATGCGVVSGAWQGGKRMWQLQKHRVFYWRLKDGLFIESCCCHLRFSC